MSENGAEQEGPVYEGTMYVSELTIDEFKQLMAEILDARKPQATARKTVEAPEGYTVMVTDAAALLNVGEMRVRGMCRDGAFGDGGAIKAGGRWCISQAAFDTYALRRADAKVTKKATKKAARVAKVEEDAEVELDELDLDAIDDGEPELTAAEEAQATKEAYARLAEEHAVADAREQAEFEAERAAIVEERELALAEAGEDEAAEVEADAE